MSSIVGPGAFIGEGVELGENVGVGPGTVILGPAVIEDDVWIGPGVLIGGPPEIASLPQNRAWEGTLDHAGVHIKRGAVIREGVVIHQGSHRVTTVGERSWLLNRAYLAHDVVVGDNTTISGGVSIGGHCTIGDHVNIGMNAAVHQRRVIAAGAMIGMGTPVTRDIPPFAKVFGTPPRFHGLNTVMLQHHGFDDITKDALLKHYTEHGPNFDRGVPHELSKLQAWLRPWMEHGSPRAISTEVSGRVER